MGHLHKPAWTWPTWPSMLTVALILLTHTIALKQTDTSNEVYEIRIYENAPPGTKATLNELFDRVLRDMKNCFAQLESDVDWIEFDSELIMFITTKDVPSTAQPMQYATLHLMCASNKMKSITFSLHVTRRNRHPPRFDRDHYTLFAPATLRPGQEVGRVQVQDQDPIAYNSQLQLSLVPTDAEPAATAFFAVHRNGSVRVRKPLADGLHLYRAYELKLVAFDFGSPQLFSIARLTLVPVSVSAPRNVRVNVAFPHYQLFEWDRPAYGLAQRVRVEVARGPDLLHSFEVAGERTAALSRQPLPPGPDYRVTVVAVDGAGRTPAEPYKFSLSEKEISCRGRCADGGRPMCFYGADHRVAQFADVEGAHCLCYAGFTGHQCDRVERCGAEKSMETFGGVDWPDTPVNQSAAVPCPYNADGTSLERRCVWAAAAAAARWENVSFNEVCKKQSAILVHLGVLANYVQRQDQTAAGFNAVQRFLDSILRFPAFMHNVTSAHFDDKIAEHTVQVLDSMLSRNLHDLPGNSTQARRRLRAFVTSFGRRLPTPYSLESVQGGLQMRSQHWIAGADSFPTKLADKCYLHLPKAVRSAVLLLACMKNHSIYDVPEASAAASVPVLVVESMDERDPLVMPSGQKLLVALRPTYASVFHQPQVNYTCAFLDEKQRGWSADGVTVLSRNFEDGMVLCEALRPGVYTLLPEHLFERRFDWLNNLVQVGPMITSFLAVVVTLFLLLINLCQRHTDPAVSVFLFMMLVVHAAHLFVFTMPTFFDIRALDESVYYTLQFAILSIGALIALINSSVYGKILELEQDYREGRHTCVRVLFILLFSIVVPSVSCLVTWTSRSRIFSMVVTRQPQLHALSPSFGAAFLAPLVLYMGVAMGYGAYAFYHGGRVVMATRMAESKEDLLHDLSHAAGASVLVMLVFYGEAVLFLEKYGVFKNLIFAVLQLLTTLLVFVFIGYIYRVEARFKRAAGLSSHGSDDGHSATTASTRDGYRNSKEQDVFKDRLLDSQTDKSSSSASSPGIGANGGLPNNNNNNNNNNNGAYAKPMVTEYGPGGYRTSALMKQEQPHRFAQRHGVSFEPTLGDISREPSYIDEGSTTLRRPGSTQPYVSIV